MGVKSRQEQEAERLYSQIGALNTQVENPFANYKLRTQPLSVSDLDTRTEAIFGQEATNLRNLLNQRRMEDLRAITQRLINQGVAGGSRQALQQRVASQYAGQEQSGLAQLLSQKLQQKMQNLLTAQQSQQAFDQLAMSLLGQKANIDLSNVRNRMGQYQMQQQLLGMFDDTTWLDDVLAVANTAGSIATGFLTAGSSNKLMDLLGSVLKNK